jgi:site-specific DNA-methyltransferase (adenine-specific)
MKPKSPIDARARILRGDVLAFARHYKGPPCHAILCDPPYHLYDIGQPRSRRQDGIGYPKARIQARAGFVGKTWDGGDLAFNPETWAALASLLYPGAFVMAFAGTRGYHRMACAMEDAGLIIHPAIGWLFGSGFPKATRIDTKIDEAAGRRAVIKRRTYGVRSTLASRGIADAYDETAPATPLAREWAGHRYGLQALKPAFEFVAVAQKPYHGKPLDSIVATGAGALNIEGARIDSASPRRNIVDRGGLPDKDEGAVYPRTRHGRRMDGTTMQGRWPANFALAHMPECRSAGASSTRGAHKSDHVYSLGIGTAQDGKAIGYGDETVAAYECAEGCPVVALDRTVARSSGMFNAKDHNDGATSGMFAGRGTPYAMYADTGGASRFFLNADWNIEVEEEIALADSFRYHPKAARSERDEGLFASEKARNLHPTVKPTDLCRWLATLLLPPTLYTPRRILVPFAGSGSEMLGAWLAGWDKIVGIEREREYVALAKARLEYWLGAGRQTSFGELSG